MTIRITHREPSRSPTRDEGERVRLEGGSRAGHLGGHDRLPVREVVGAGHRGHERRRLGRGDGRAEREPEPGAAWHAGDGRSWILPDSSEVAARAHRRGGTLCLTGER
jgi:hypothetical protein